MKTEQLKGKKLLLIESEDLVAGFSEHMHKRWGLLVLGKTSVPDALHDYLVQGKFDMAAIHPQDPREVVSVAQACLAGSKILIIGQPQYTAEYERFTVLQNLGIEIGLIKDNHYMASAVVTALAKMY